tara:strand:- start:907 stop:1158 length:252 start_codon:yes stop_codon:yes gene_type:complete
MSKQLILITAPFNCGHCVKAIKELPSICEEQGFEFIEMKNEKGSKDNLPVDLYPTIMVRINEEIKHTISGYNQNKLLTELKKY